MNFIKWLKKDYARTKVNWFCLQEMRGKNPTEKGFKLYYFGVGLITMWFAPLAYLWEKRMIKKYSDLTDRA